jgi:hypothetical protein
VVNLPIGSAGAAELAWGGECIVAAANRIPGLPKRSCQKQELCLAPFGAAALLANLTEALHEHFFNRYTYATPPPQGDFGSLSGLILAVKVMEVLLPCRYVFVWRPQRSIGGYISAFKCCRRRSFRLKSFAWEDHSFIVSLWLQTPLSEAGKAHKALHWSIVPIPSLPSLSFSERVRPFKMSSPALVSTEWVSQTLKTNPKLNATASSTQQPRKLLLKTKNLAKVPSGSLLRRYLKTDGHYMERLAAKDIPTSGSITVDQLDTFMQTVTDKKILQAARTSMSGGNSNTH